MLLDIKWKLKRLSRLADPDPKFQRALRKELRAMSKPRSWSSFFLKPAAVLLSVMFILGGTGAYAYASDDVLPEHPLYPIREGIERVEQSMAVTPAQRAKLELRLLKKRVRELEMAAKRQNAVKPRQVDKFSERFGRALEAGTFLPNGERDRFDATLSDLEQKQALMIQRIKERSPAERERLERALEAQTQSVAERIANQQEKRQARFMPQLKRRAAIEHKLPWKLEERGVRVLPPEASDDARTAVSIMDSDVTPVTATSSRPLRLEQVRPLESIRLGLKGIVMQGKLVVEKRADGHIQLVATTSTPPGIRLLLNDINVRLASEPGLLPE